MSLSQTGAQAQLGGCTAPRAAEGLSQQELCEQPSLCKAGLAEVANVASRRMGSVPSMPEHLQFSGEDTAAEINKAALHSQRGLLGFLWGQRGEADTSQT